MKQTKKTIEKINETKSWFFEKINKIDKPLARLIKKKRERAQINKIINDKEVSANTIDIQRTIRDCCEQLYANNNSQARRNGQILRYNLPRLNQEEIENMNRSVTSNETESVI